MRKEAARYAAELARKDDEARRAKQPLEKLQRPTLVSRTDTSITLNLHRSKNTNQTLPKDRCWELSLTKERERDYSVFTSVKGKTVVTVSDLIPGTRYCFKARVGRVEPDGDVSEWGPYSVESAYATSGKAPPEHHGTKSHGAKADGQGRRRGKWRRRRGYPRDDEQKGQETRGEGESRRGGSRGGR